MKDFQNFVDVTWKPDFWNYDSTGNAVILKGQAVSFSNAGGQFANMRTKIYFDLKRKLVDGIYVHPEVMREHWPLIKQELDATSLNLEKEVRKPIIIPKDKIKIIIKRSPDRTDGFALSCIPPVSTVDYNKLRSMQAAANPYRA
jgi:hypothetical protein